MSSSRDVGRSWARRAYVVARWLYLPVVLACIVFGLQGSAEELKAAASQVDLWRAGAAAMFVVAGLLITSVVWCELVSWLGAPTSLRAGQRIFFIGQLGKYVPGSIWNVATQASMAASVGLDFRVVVAASISFLWMHLASALLVASSAALLLGAPALIPSTAAWGLLALSVAMCSSAAVTAFARILLRRRIVSDVGIRRCGVLLLSMACVWVAYGAALTLVTPGLSANNLARATAAFALAYAIGVVVVVAPAGAGAREVAIGLLLEPMVGLAAASVGALMSRVCHTAADVVLAASAWTATRSPRHSSNVPP